MPPEPSPRRPRNSVGGNSAGASAGTLSLSSAAAGDVARPRSLGASTEAGGGKAGSAAAPYAMPYPKALAAPSGGAGRTLVIRTRAKGNSDRSSLAGASGAAPPCGDGGGSSGAGGNGIGGGADSANSSPRRQPTSPPAQARRSTSSRSSRKQLPVALASADSPRRGSSNTTADPLGGDGRCPTGSSLVARLLSQRGSSPASRNASPTQAKASPPRKRSARPRKAKRASERTTRPQPFSFSASRPRHRERAAYGEEDVGQPPPTRSNLTPLEGRAHASTLVAAVSAAATPARGGAGDRSSSCPVGGLVSPGALIRGAPAAATASAKGLPQQLAAVSHEGRGSGSSMAGVSPSEFGASGSGLAVASGRSDRAAGNATGSGTNGSNGDGAAGADRSLRRRSSPPRSAKDVTDDAVSTACSSPLDGGDTSVVLSDGGGSGAGGSSSGSGSGCRSLSSASILRKGRRRSLRINAGPGQVQGVCSLPFEERGRHVSFCGGANGGVEVVQFAVEEEFAGSTTRGPRRIFGGELQSYKAPAPYVAQSGGTTGSVALGSLVGIAASTATAAAGEASSCATEAGQPPVAATAAAKRPFPGDRERLSLPGGWLSLPGDLCENAVTRCSGSSCCSNSSSGSAGAGIAGVASFGLPSEQASELRQRCPTPPQFTAPLVRHAAAASAATPATVGPLRFGVRDLVPI